MQLFLSFQTYFWNDHWRIGCGVQSVFFLSEKRSPIHLITGRTASAKERYGALWSMEKLLPFRAFVLPILLTGNRDGLDVESNPPFFVIRIKTSVCQDFNIISMADFRHTESHSTNCRTMRLSKIFERPNSPSRCCFPCLGCRIVCYIVFRPSGWAT